MDILDRLRDRTQPATHWETCADYHDLCAAIEEIERLRKELALRQDYASKVREQGLEIRRLERELAERGEA